MMRRLRKIAGAALVASVPVAGFCLAVRWAGWRGVVIALGAALSVLGAMSIGFWLLDDGEGEKRGKD